MIEEDAVDKMGNLLSQITNELLASRALTLALMINHPELDKVKATFLDLMKDHESIISEDNPENIEEFKEAYQNIISQLDAAIRKK